MDVLRSIMYFDPYSRWLTNPELLKEPKKYMAALNKKFIPEIRELRPEFVGVILRDKSEYQYYQMY